MVSSTQELLEMRRLRMELVSAVCRRCCTTRFATLPSTRSKSSSPFSKCKKICDTHRTDLANYTVSRVEAPDAPRHRSRRYTRLYTYFFEGGHRNTEAADAEAIGATTHVVLQFVEKNGELVDGRVRQNERQLLAIVAGQFYARDMTADRFEYFAAGVAIFQHQPVGRITRLQILGNHT